MSAIKKRVADVLINVSKNIFIPVLMPQIQLLNAHLLQLGLDKQLYIYGTQVGVEVARMAGKAMGRERMSLDELVEWTPFIIKHLTIGIASGRIVEVNREKGEYTVRVYNSPYAKLPDGKTLSLGRPACHMLAGIFAGGATRVLGKPYSAVETKCIAKGDDYCEFKLKPVQ